jgi:hypothetical protein
MEHGFNGKVNRRERHRSQPRTAGQQEDFGSDSRPSRDWTGEQVQVNQPGTVDTDSVIRDMAKGFVEAQAGLNSAGNGVSGELMKLLSKISAQLDELRQSDSPLQKQPENNAPSVKSHGQGNSAAAADAVQQQPAQEVQAANSTGQSQGAAAGQTEQRVSQSLSAVQLLNQAQFELSKELEASLGKLRQVIAESENLAQRISGMASQDDKSQ